LCSTFFPQLADEATKYEDELMEETMNQGASEGTDGDETAMRALTDKKETSSDENGKVNFIIRGARVHWQNIY